MSKFFIIKYRNNIVDFEKKTFQNILQNISSSDIKSKYQLIESNISSNLYIGIVNPIEEIIDSGQFTYGNKLKENNNTLLPDGSYAEIVYNQNEIKFYCDRFESKTIWYYFDNEKLIISNSQRAIISLKKSFKLNENAVSWFLSSGSLGFLNAWDQEIFKVQHSKVYHFDLESFSLEVFNSEYCIDSDVINKYSDEKFITLTNNNFPSFNQNTQLDNCIFPLSGGYDSRLIYYLARDKFINQKLNLINWGKLNNNIFDDKKAALEITSHYKDKLIDEVLPDEITDVNLFFEKYIKLSDCRVDHFNAFSDNFNIFKKLYNKNFKLIIRGDIPFTEGLDLNNKMSRSHIGINIFDDFDNLKDYDLEKWKNIQENNLIDISKKDSETFIQWRDRLYIDYRIPIVISSFNDMINCFIDIYAPMMSYSHYKLYTSQSDKYKGNKNHIVRISKNLDQSNVSFDALPSIPSMNDLFLNLKSLEEIKILIANSELFSQNLLKQILQDLDKINLNTNTQNKKSLKDRLKQLITNNVSIELKAKLKSKIPLNLNVITLAYRIILIEKLNHIFEEDSKLN